MEVKTLFLTTVMFLFIFMVELALTMQNNSDSINIKKEKKKRILDLYKEYNKESLEWQKKCNYSNWSVDHGCNISGLLSALLLKYDKRLRPLMDKQRPVTVTVGFWILSIDSINVIDMDYQIDFFFRQSWKDPRLRHSYPHTLTISNTMLNKIWVPDTYFENSKYSHFHDVTIPNKMLKIKPDGTILYNARISVRASCPMDLRMFPMDVQECDLNIESYGYSTRDILFLWEPQSTRISIGRKVRKLPQYNLTGFRTFERQTQYIVGNFSGLTATFVLERRTGYFFLHLYAPCALIVMISWISFCIPKDATAARVALGITSVLTITTILNMLNTAMPKVSYIKAVDWYLIVSFLLVFAVLIEYTFVLYLTDRERQIQKKVKKSKRKKHLSRIDIKHSHQPNGQVVNGNGEMRSRCQMLNKTSETAFYNQSDDDSTTTYSNKPLILLVENNNSPNSTNNYNDEYDKKYDSENLKSNLCCHFRVDCIDEYSRIIFPLSFITFNTVYWLLFFNIKHSDYG